MNKTFQGAGKINFFFFLDTLFDLISKAEQWQPKQSLLLSVIFFIHCSYFLR